MSAEPKVIATGPREEYFIQHPFTYKIFGPFQTKEQAATRAIKLNAKDDERPAFLLLKFDKKLQVIAQLTRKFGDMFNEKDCWR